MADAWYDPNDQGSYEELAANRRRVIENAYQSKLGRAYDQPGFDLWYGSGIRTGDLESSIAGSPEAQAWAAKANQTAPPPPSGGGGSTTPWDSSKLEADLWNIKQSGQRYNLGQFMAAHPEYAQAGVKVKNNSAGQPESLILPDGREIDVVGDINAQGFGTSWWGDPAARAANAASAAAGGGGGTAAAGGGAGAGAGAVSSATRDQLFQMLMDRAKQGLNINAQTDFNIRQQADPYAAAVERARRNYLADTAEKRGPYANLQGEERVTAQKAGEASGLFESTLVGKELTARRDEIQHALDTMAGMLSQDQTVALQRELAATNDALQRTKMQQENDQFLAQLGFNASDRAAYWDAVRKGLI